MGQGRERDRECNGGVRQGSSVREPPRSQQHQRDCRPLFPAKQVLDLCISSALSCIDVSYCLSVVTLSLSNPRAVSRSYLRAVLFGAWCCCAPEGAKWQGKHYIPTHKHRAEIHLDVQAECDILASCGYKGKSRSVSNIVYMKPKQVRANDLKKGPNTY